MTILDFPPSVRKDSPSSAIPPRRHPAATWRFASRLARREVRRRPGRTALAALLVAVPVAAMTLGSIVLRTVDDDWGATFERRYGAADLVAVGVPLGMDGTSSESPTDLSSIDAALSALPAGSDHVVGLVTWTGLELADGSSPSEVYVRFTDLPIDHRITAGIVEVSAGRAPTGPDEVLFDPSTADRLGVGIGDVIELARPSGSWRVVGLGRAADNHREALMVVHDFATDRVRPDSAQQTLLVTLPAGATAADAVDVQEEWVRVGVEGWNRWFMPWGDDSAGVAPVAWGWVAGVLALVGVGIVVAAAFATSARRQLVTVGHLAANGAPTALVRRSLSMQGTWTGMVGVAVGMTAAIVGLLLGRSVVESLVNRSIGQLRFVPVDLVVIAATGLTSATIAAAVPARTAARVPVLSSLAGRRPLGDVPRRLVPIGLTLFLGGLATLFVAATGAQAAADTGRGSDLFALVAIVGGVAVVFGMCCATPLAVSWIGRAAGSSGSATWRLAMRSLARTRTRSAAVVTAVAAAGALAVAGVTIASATVDDLAVTGGLATNVAVIEQWTDWWVPVGDGSTVLDPPRLQPFDLDAALRADLERIAPGALLVPVRAAGFDPRPFDQVTWGDESAPGVAVRVDDPFVALIADDTLVELLGLDAAARERLAERDVLHVHDVERSWTTDGESFADIATDGGSDAVWPVVLADERGDVSLTEGSIVTQTELGSSWTLMTERTARRLGLDIVDRGVVLVTADDLTPVQRRDLETVIWSGGRTTVFVEPGDPILDREVDAAEGEAGTWRTVSTSPQSNKVPLALIHGLIIASAILFTLLVVAIGLSLSAAESRDERTVLVSVGAKPSTLSRLAGAKAMTLALVGVLLAVPTGYLPTWVVQRALDARAYATTAPFPSATIALLVIVVPAIAGLTAWTTSSIARRIRPVRVTTQLGE